MEWLDYMVILLLILELPNVGIIGDSQYTTMLYLGSFQDKETQIIFVKISIYHQRVTV